MWRDILYNLLTTTLVSLTSLLLIWTKILKNYVLKFNINFPFPAKPTKWRRKSEVHGMSLATVFRASPFAEPTQRPLPSGDKLRPPPSTLTFFSFTSDFDVPPSAPSLLPNHIPSEPSLGPRTYSFAGAGLFALNIPIDGSFSTVWRDYHLRRIPSFCHVFRE